MKIKELIERGHDFVENGIWKTDDKQWGKNRRRLISVLRIMVMTVKGYFKGRVVIQASALTYYTILSIVPTLAIAFAVAKGFGMESLLTSYIEQSMSSAPETANYLIGFAANALNNTNSGIIAGIGAVMLIYTVYSLLSNIENAFNTLWCIDKPRAITRKLTDYLCIMLLTPILLILASSLTLFVDSLLDSFFSDTISPLQTFLIECAPLLLMTIVFTLLFLIIPNTRVHFNAALIAGIVTAVGYELLQWVYITFQVGVNKAGAIYGSFAFLPLFLAWLQLVWTIVLAGCKISFSIQNVSRYGMDVGASSISVNMEEKMSMLIMYRLTKNFSTDKPKTNGQLLQQELKIPFPIFFGLMNKLRDVGLVAELSPEKDGSRTYVPGMDTADITPNLVCHRLHNSSKDCEKWTNQSDDLQTIEKEIEQIKLNGTVYRGNTPLCKM